MLGKWEMGIFDAVAGEHGEIVSIKAVQFIDDVFTSSNAIQFLF